MTILGTIKQKLGAKEAIQGAKPKAPARAVAKKQIPAAPPAAGSSSVIAAPHVTEKASFLQATANTYVFKVARQATANEVKKAVERAFGVTVVRVNMANLPAKNIRVGIREGRVPGFRKAMVVLKEGDKIEAGA